MRARKLLNTARRRGQSTIEFVVAYAGILLPMTFMVIFTAQILWIWHSVNEYTRLGAEYAVTHCWTSSGGNVADFMRSHIPPMVNQDQFQGGAAQIAVTYLGKDPDTGQLTPFTCDTECSVSCVPDTVAVSVTGY